MKGKHQNTCPFLQSVPQFLFAKIWFSVGNFSHFVFVFIFVFSLLYLKARMWILPASVFKTTATHVLKIEDNQNCPSNLFLLLPWTSLPGHSSLSEDFAQTHYGPQHPKSYLSLGAFSLKSVHGTLSPWPLFFFFF